MKEWMKIAIGGVLTLVIVIWFVWMVTWCFDLPFSIKIAVGVFLILQFYKIFLERGEDV